MTHEGTKSTHARNGDDTQQPATRALSTRKRAGRSKTNRLAFPRMTFPRALRSEFIRMHTSPLVAAHLACALAAGLACGAYFAFAPWNPAQGADAYAQFLGALMPLMAGIVCGLAFDAEREAGGMANLTGVPSRPTAVAAKITMLFLMGAATLALAIGLFALILALAGRSALSPVAYVWCIAGLTLGSAPLYILSSWLALRFGRNAAIGVGAVGLLLAFFSIGGLAHGLMTGELTGAYPGILGYIPLTWSARLGSLGVENGMVSLSLGAHIEGSVMNVAAHVHVQTLLTAGLCLALSAAALIVLLTWFNRFEE